ncbi:MAG: Holliday junction resolvase RuvX [Anaerolineae bacterium]
MRILALDVGERRIGVAVSDPMGIVARPVATVERASREEDFAAINALVDKHQAELVVVGLPLTLRGEVGPQAQTIKRYAEALEQELAVPMKLWDERYTTASAEDVLRRRKDAGRRGGKRGIDAVAAAFILQTYLDSAE